MSTVDNQDRFRWQRVQDLFHKSAAVPDAERVSYLRGTCDGDETLIKDVMAMLEEDAGSGSFLDQDLPDVAHSLLAALPGSFSQDEFRQYQIGKLLGEGGAGTVYLAQRADMGNVVAIKILSSGTLSPARRQRFTEEQKTLAQLDHPFIARIFDADTLRDGTPWFAMEYVEGVSITTYCQAHNSSIGERLGLFRAVCEAVQYAHARTIIHLDLKPSNMLVKADGTLKLLDFGIARQLAEADQKADATKTGRWPMTLAYASPEQIRGEPLGIQSDIYSLGVILYELLTERPPFDLSNKTLTEAERLVLEQGVPPPSSAVRSFAKSGTAKAIPGKTAWSDLDVLCLTAMHRDPGRRYSSAEALIRDIDHYEKSEPLKARPDSLRYRLGKFTYRNRRILSATAAALVIIVTLTLVFIVRLARERSAVLAEARRTQRIERFMLNLFDGGDTTAAPADNLRAVTLIDRGVQNAHALANEPGIQADLYQTLGNIYQKLGRLDDANRLLGSSIEQHKSVNGPDSAEEAQALVALGLLRLDQSRIPEAEHLVRDGLSMSKRHLASDDPAITKAMSALGRVLEERGAYGDAIKLLDETVRLQSAQQATSTDLSASIAELANAHYYSGHFPLAETLNNRALVMDRQLFGNIHPRVADDLINLGEIQHDLGQETRAEAYYRQALAIKQSWYGNDHPETAITMSAVGQALVFQGRYDEAAGLLERALSIQEKFFGKVHSQVAMGLNTLALLDLKRGHLTESEAEFSRMADINRSIYGDRHYLVGVALLNLGEVYVQEKQYGQAENAFRGALDRFREKLPAGHQNTAIASIKLGHVLLLQRQYTDAEMYLTSGYQTLMHQQSPPASRLSTARTDLAEVYDALHKPDLARSLRAQSVAAAAKASDRPATK